MPDIGSLSSEIQKLEKVYSLSNKFVIAFTFATAIVAALYFIATYVNSSVGTKLNQAKDELSKIKENESAKIIASLNAETEKAKEERAKADLKIEEARENSAKANNQAQSAIATAAEANEETAKAVKEQELLRKQNLELSLQVEKERVARLLLEEKIAPRHVTNEQLAKFVSNSSFKRITKNIKIEVDGSDGEATQYANELLNLFLKCRLHASGQAGTYAFVLPPGYISIASNTGDLDSQALALKDGLDSIGIPTYVFILPKWPGLDSDITIFVGKKKHPETQ